MIDDQKFEKAIRAKLASHESPVKDDMWKAIEARLPQSAPHKVPLYRRVLWYSAAAVAAGIVATIILWPSTDQKLYAPIVTDNTSVATETVQPVGVQSREQSASEKPVLQKNIPITFAKSASKPIARTTSQQPVAAATTTAPKTETGKATEETQQLDNEPRTTPKPETYRREMEEFEKDGKELREATLTDEPTRKEKRKGIKVGLMASNSISGNSRNSATAIRTKNPLFMSRRDPVYKFDHSIPLSVGVTASKSFAKNWEVESGVVYTYLYSKYYSSNSNGSQELHYLGVPIDIIYRFARIKRASFYASIGGEADFYLAGRQKDEGYDEGISGSGYKKLKHENVQFSVHANIGAALTLYKQLELYLEPHVAYYIENNSSIQNIWKDKPFNFGLTLGLRTGF